MVITKIKDKWIVDYRINGVRKRPSFSTKAEAQAFKRELMLRDVDKQTGYQSLIEVNLKNAIRKYVQFVSSKKSHQTQVSEKKYFEKMYDEFGNCLVSEISLHQVETLQLKLSERVTNATVNRHFNTYRHFFKKCEDWDYIRNNPTLKLKNLKVAKVKRKVWQSKDIQLILNVAPKWVADPFYLLATTGIRAGEACRLRFKDINTQSMMFETSSTKGTGEERVRVLPMSPELADFFNRLRTEAKKSFRSKSSDLIFRNSGGAPLNSNQLSRAVRRLIGIHKLDGLTLHGLRNTFISELAAQNHSIEKIRLLVGHENLKTTQGYLHMDQEELRSTVIALESKRKLVHPGH